MAGCAAAQEAGNLRASGTTEIAAAISSVEDGLVDKFCGTAVPGEWLPALFRTVTQLPALRRKPEPRDSRLG